MCKESNLHQVFSVNFQQLKMISFEIMKINFPFNDLKRSFEELVSFIFRECSFPHGCLIMTGTGIVPEHDFSLKSGDKIKISIDGIGTLVNEVS